MHVYLTSYLRTLHLERITRMYRLHRASPSVTLKGINKQTNRERMPLHEASPSRTRTCSYSESAHHRQRVAAEAAYLQHAMKVCMAEGVSVTKKFCPTLV